MTCLGPVLAAKTDQDLALVGLAQAGFVETDAPSNLASKSLDNSLELCYTYFVSLVDLSSLFIRTCYEKSYPTTNKSSQHSLVLKTIYDAGQISRADIARLTGLTRTTVSDAVAELMQDGLVAEVGLGPSAGGKPPILVSVVDDSRYLIGIDLADSEFREAGINLRGEIKHRLSLPIYDRDGDAALALVYEFIEP